MNDNKKQIIYNNVSLKYLLGTVFGTSTGVDKIEKCLIVSDSKPDIFIKYLSLDITEFITESILDDGWKEFVEDVEVEFHNFIVFTINKEEKTLMNMSLLEYINIHDDTFLTQEIWKFIEINPNPLTEIDINNNLE